MGQHRYRADHIRGQYSVEHQTPLNTINYFLNSYLKETVSVVHILPFFPYSSDDGFSVIDYSTVNPSHGNWEQLTQVKLTSSSW